VADVFDRVLGALIGGGGASLFAWGLLALGIGVVGALAARFARGVTPDAGLPASSVSAPLRTATDWRSEAEAHERAGRWRPALRCRYRALVAELAAGRAASFDAGTARSTGKRAFPVKAGKAKATQITSSRAMAIRPWKRWFPSIVRSGSARDDRATITGAGP